MSTLFSHFFAKNNEIRPQEANFTEVLESIAVKPKMFYFYGICFESHFQNYTFDESSFQVCITRSMIQIKLIVYTTSSVHLSSSSCIWTSNYLSINH